jgi:hypothetical protein
MRLKSSKKSAGKENFGQGEQGPPPPRTFHGHENHIIPAKFLLVFMHRYVGRADGPVDDFPGFAGIAWRNR